MALKPNALKKIYHEILETTSEVITWQHDFFDEEHGIASPNFYCNVKKGFKSSNEIIESFLSADLEFFLNHSPRGYNSCVDMKIVDKIEKSSFLRLCMPVSPDYTMSFQILNIVDKVFSLPDVLVTMNGLKYSSGESFFKKGELGNQFVKEMNMKFEDLFKNSPLTIRTTYNTLVNDFFIIAKKQDNRLSQFKLNQMSYVIYLYEELKRAEELKIDVRKEMDQWNEFLYHQDPIFIESVKKGIEFSKRKNDLVANSQMYYFIKKIQKLGFFIVLYQILRSIAWKHRNGVTFSSVQEFIKHEY
jgi:hypothetical protein